ncbi:N/A [soil metagenome]
MSKILLVEPDRVLAKTYHQSLVSAGHEVHTCNSAQAAIIAADQICPDVVVLELQLVAHSGVEFLYEFRSYPDWQDIPVVVHTSVPPNRFASNFADVRTQLRISQYLYKPLTSLRQLRETVQAVSTIGV